MPLDTQLLQLLASLPQKGSPEEIARIIKGFTRRTQLTPRQEEQFQIDFKPLKDVGQDPDDPTWDARAAWLEGKLPQPGQHGLSVFKGIGDARLLLPIGQGGKLLDTRTAEGPIHGQYNGPDVNPSFVTLHNLISSLMTGRHQ